MNEFTQAARSDAIADENGELVHRFSLTMHNLGLGRAGEELLTMLRSSRWQQWSQGGMTFRFLAGEFDYFLTQQDIQREQVMIIPDVEIKAQLEAAMDERRTGEAGYRRSIAVARREIPELPGRSVLPYGYGAAEYRSLTGGKDVARSKRRSALGDSVRRYRDSDGSAARARRDERPRWERLAAAAARLPDDEFNRLLSNLEQERSARKQRLF